MYNSSWPGNEPTYEPLQVQTKAAYQARALEDGFLLPLLKAGVIGFLAGVFVVLLFYAFKASFSPWLAGALTWFGISLFAFWRYSERGQKLIEAICGVDLKPIPAYPQLEVSDLPPLQVKIEENNGRNTTIAHIPPQFVDRMRLIAPLLLQGKSFSERELKTVFHQGEFDKLRNEFLARGLVRWNNEQVHQLGVTFTHTGKRMLEEFVTQAPGVFLPSPTRTGNPE